MQSETKYTKQDLETMRAWSLQRKIQVTQTRIIEWIGRYDWNVYISFSGGKDSTVLADLTARAYQAFWCPNRKEPLHLVFVNTGLEYPEIQKFVKYFAKWLERQYEIPVDLKVLTPELTFPEVLTKYGYPVIGKEVAKVIYYARHGSQWALNRLDGLDKRGKPSKFKERYKKYKFIFKSITFDNGTEFAAAEGLERSCVNKRLPRTKVYFCHPYSSWERGTNENTNGMIRRRFPKGTNFAAVTNAQIAQAENWINNYPRKILGYKSSEIVFRECLRELGIAA